MINSEWKKKQNNSFQLLKKSLWLRELNIGWLMKKRPQLLAIAELFW